MRRGHRGHAARRQPRAGAQCRAAFERRFSVTRMAADYVRSVPNGCVAERHSDATMADGSGMMAEMLQARRTVRHRRARRRGRPRRPGAQAGRASPCSTRTATSCPRDPASKGSTTRARAFCRDSSCCSANRPPLLLSSTISEDNTVFTADLDQPRRAAGRTASSSPAGLLHIFRSRVLCERRAASSASACRTTRSTPSRCRSRFRFDADFADIFEVRGTRRAAPRATPAGHVAATDAVLRYAGSTASSGRPAFDRCAQPDQVDERRAVVLCCSSSRTAASTSRSRSSCEIARTRADARTRSATRVVQRAAAGGGTRTAASATCSARTTPSTAGCSGRPPTCG